MGEKINEVENREKRYLVAKFIFNEVQENFSSKEGKYSINSHFINSVITLKINGKDRNFVVIRHRTKPPFQLTSANRLYFARRLCTPRYRYFSFLP